MAKVPLHERWHERSDAARVTQAETRLAETLARLEELQRFARNMASLAHEITRLSEHRVYEEELADIIAQARR